MARYGRDEFDSFSRRPRRGAPRNDRYGGDPQGGYAGNRSRAGRGYDGGWGMTGLYNTIMDRGPRGGRYGEQSYNPPLRQGRGSYAGGRDDIRRGGYGEGGRGRRGYASDYGSIGVHYRPGGR